MTIRICRIENGCARPDLQLSAPRKVPHSAASRRPDRALLALVILNDMPLRLHHIVIDAHDLPSLARFWADALGWRILSVREREVVVGAEVDAPVGLCFMPAGSDRKTVKNRVHIDLTTTADDRDSEVARLIALGACQVNVGQTGRESWDVLADPEGNEFCVVRPKSTLVD